MNKFLFKSLIKDFYIHIWQFITTSIIFTTYFILLLYTNNTQENAKSIITTSYYFSIALSIVFVTSNFYFVNNKNQWIFINSLPLSKLDIFVKNITLTLFNVLIPHTVFYIIVAILYKISIKELFYSYIFIITFTCYYLIFILVTNNLLVTNILFFILYQPWILINIINLVIKNTSNIYRFSTILDDLSITKYLTNYKNIYEFNFIKSITILIIVISVSYLLFLKRTNFSYNVSIIYKPLHIYFLFVVSIGLSTNTFVFNNYQINFIILITYLYLVHFLLEEIINFFNIKKILKYAYIPVFTLIFITGITYISNNFYNNISFKQNQIDNINTYNPNYSLIYFMDQKTKQTLYKNYFEPLTNKTKKSNIFTLLSFDNKNYDTENSMYLKLKNSFFTECSLHLNEPNENEQIIFKNTIIENFNNLIIPENFKFIYYDNNKNIHTMEITNKKQKKELLQLYINNYKYNKINLDYINHKDYIQLNYEHKLYIPNKKLSKKLINIINNN